MISSQDLFLILFLAFLEAVLSIDNAVVLATMAKHLPKAKQKKALTYGLGGSILFRLIALSLATHLIKWHWVKLAGGLYLLYVATSHLFFKSKTDEHEHQHRAHSFWKTVILIEFMDIAFAVDSILAAVALTTKFWIIFVGGMLGVLAIRYAASMFIALMNRFPGFEKAGDLLILVIAAKLILDWWHLPGVEFESPHNPAFWIFWGSMLMSFLYGFLPVRSNKE